MMQYYMDLTSWKLLMCYFGFAEHPWQFQLTLPRCFCKCVYGKKTKPSIDSCGEISMLQQKRTCTNSSDFPLAIPPRHFALSTSCRVTANRTPQNIHRLLKQSKTQCTLMTCWTLAKPSKKPENCKKNYRPY